MIVKFALAQINPVLGDIYRNKEKHLRFIEKAINQKSDVVIFPELSLTGYSLLDLSMEVALKPDDSFFSPFLKLSNHIDISFGFVEKSNDKVIYNSAMYLSRGDIKHVYRKIYLPTHGMFQELRFFGRGRTVKAFDTKFGRVSLLICRDFFHPSLLFLSYADKSDFVIAMSNMPLRGVSGKEPAIQSMVEKAADTYAGFFGMFVVFVNRVGFEDGMGFYGGSFVESPTLERAGFAGILRETMTFTKVDTEDIYKRRQGFPLLREEDFDLVHKNLDRIIEGGNND
jgi:predicted amidohydrolase